MKPTHIVKHVGEFGFVLDFGRLGNGVTVLKPNGPGDSIIEKWEGDEAIIVPKGALDRVGRYVIYIPNTPDLLILDVID